MFFFLKNIYPLLSAWTSPYYAMSLTLETHQTRISCISPLPRFLILKKSQDALCSRQDFAGILFENGYGWWLLRQHFDYLSLAVSNSRDLSGFAKRNLSGCFPHPDMSHTHRGAIWRVGDFKIHSSQLWIKHETYQWYPITSHLSTKFKSALIITLFIWLSSGHKLPFAL